MNAVSQKGFSPKLLKKSPMALAINKNIP